MSFSNLIICSHNGYQLIEEKECEEDNIKNFHLVYENGKYIQLMPYSPYRSPPGAVFKMWIESGMPSYSDMGGQSDDHIFRYYSKWLDRQIDKLLVEEMTDAL